MERNIGAKERMAHDTNVMVVESQATMWIGKEKKFRRGEEYCFISLYFLKSNTPLSPFIVLTTKTITNTHL